MLVFDYLKGQAIVVIVILRGLRHAINLLCLRAS